MTIATLTAPVHDGVPPLCSGDNLSREEFERIWDLHPEIKRAELIDGVVFVEMTVSQEHGAAHAKVVTWLGVYAGDRDDIVVADNIAVHLGENDVQPDACLRRTGADARSRVVGSTVEGPPEFVFEVAVSSAAYDLFQKRAVYEEFGVLEYAVWQLHEGTLEWFRLEAGRYQRVAPDAGGVIESAEFPGLRLNVPSLLAGRVSGLIAHLGR